MIEWKKKQMGFHDFGSPDFVAYAESCGASGRRIGATAELKPLIEECCAEGGVHLIYVPVNYSDNDCILNREIRELSSKL